MNGSRYLQLSLGLLLAGLSACGGGESVSVLLDPEVRLLRQEPNQGKAAALKGYAFGRIALGRRGLKYERLDQPVIELLLGVR